MDSTPIRLTPEERATLLFVVRAFVEGEDARYAKVLEFGRAINVHVEPQNHRIAQARELLAKMERGTGLNEDCDG